MNLKDLKNELLQDPEFRKEYYKNDIAMDIALMIEEARIVRGLTQKELAKRMRTKQTAISRVESGDYLPSLSFLERMAKALKTELIAPRFSFLEKDDSAIAIDKLADWGAAAETARFLKESETRISSLSLSDSYQNRFIKK